MSRINGPAWKASCHLGFSILEIREEFQKRAYTPGQHGPTKRVKLIDYGQQLRKKQKIRYMYGLNERQFYNTFIKANKMRGVTGDNFLGLLESRLDNLVYHMGLARTRRAAHQLVNHEHILVDGKEADIPSFIAKPGMVAEVKEESRDMKAISEALEATLNIVTFIDVNEDAKKDTYLRLPERSEPNSKFDGLLVVEFYNRQC